MNNAKKLRVVLSFVLVLVMVFSMGTSTAFAAKELTKTEATSMKIASVEGTVGVVNEKGKDVKAKQDTRLLSGYNVSTEKSSYCYVNLDDAKALKLDQNSKVGLEKSGKKLELTLKSGSMYFDVNKKLAGDESMNIKTSNMTTGVRGTSGTISTGYRIARIDGKSVAIAETKIVLLSGKLVVETATGPKELLAGQVMTIDQTGQVSVNLQDEEKSSDAPAAFKKEYSRTGRASVGINAINGNDVSGFGVKASVETNGRQVLEEAMGGNVPAVDNLIARNDAAIERAEAAAEAQTVATAEQIAAEKKENITKMEQALENRATTAAIGEGETSLEAIADGAIGDIAAVEAVTGEEEIVDQVFKPVTTATARGAQSEEAPFKEEEPATVAAGGGGGGGGSSAPEALITGYVGPYDGKPHGITVGSKTLSDYHVFFVGDLGTFTTGLRDYRALYDESRMDEYNAGLELYMGNFGSTYTASEPYVTNRVNVSDSVEKYYYAISKKDFTGASDAQGDISVSISAIACEIDWLDGAGHKVTNNHPVFEYTGYDIIPVSTAAINTSSLVASDIGKITLSGITGVASAKSVGEYHEYVGALAAVGGMPDVTENYYLGASKDFAWTITEAGIGSTTIASFTYNGSNFDSSLSSNTLTAQEVADFISATNGFEKIYVKTSGSYSVTVPTFTIPRSAERTVVINGESGPITLSRVNFGSGSANVKLETLGNVNLANNFTLPSGATYINGASDMTVDSLTVSTGARAENTGLLKTINTISVDGTLINTGSIDIQNSNSGVSGIQVRAGGVYTQTGGAVTATQQTTPVISNSGTVNIATAADDTVATLTWTGAAGTPAAGGEENLMTFYYQNMFGTGVTATESATHIYRVIGGTGTFNAAFDARTAVSDSSNLILKTRSAATTDPAVTSVAFKWDGTTWNKIAGGNNTAVTEAQMLSDVAAAEYESITFNNDTLAGIHIANELVIPTNVAGKTVEFVGKNPGSSVISFDSGLSFTDGGESLAVTNDTYMDMGTSYDFSVADNVTFTNHGILNVGSLYVDGTGEFHNARISASGGEIHAARGITVNEIASVTNVNGIMYLAESAGGTITHAISNYGSFNLTGGVIIIVQTNVLAVDNSGTFNISSSESMTAKIIKKNFSAEAYPTQTTVLDYIFGEFGDGCYEFDESASDTLIAPVSGRISDTQKTSGDNAYEVCFW